MKKIIILILLIVCFITLHVYANPEVIPFDADHWQLFNGKVVEHLERQSLMGSAMLKGGDFRDGIIEFDIAVTGKRSYPGIRFRARSGADAENIYIRPHIMGVADSALQYTPVFNNAACWQLYYGEGYTSALDIPLNQWVHVKIEVMGARARVTIGDTDVPVLRIEQLKHGEISGGIALVAPPDGSAHFSNFSIDPDTQPVFEPMVSEEVPPGVLTEWEISQPFKYSRIDLEKTHDQQDLPEITWRPVACEKSGLVNVSRYIKRRGREPDFIFARTTIRSDSETVRHLDVGYSDAVVVFLNGKALFSGSSPYRGRGQLFQGIIGYYDTVILPLKKGDNHLELVVGETFGGWGFMCRDGKAVYHGDGVAELWKSKNTFATSESVLYDPRREVLYVTNFDQFSMGNPKARQSISKVSMTGEVIERHWVGDLDNPLGMTFHRDELYVAERRGIARIDPKRKKIIERIPVPGSIFLNDIAIDRKGRIYVTDSRKDVIWRCVGGKAEVWLSGNDVKDPNVIYVDRNTLFFGNSGDRTLKSVNLGDKTISNIAKFEKGFIDGFRIDEKGNYLVSLWKGKLYRITPQGEKTKLLDTTTPGYYSADFEYIKKKKLLIIPNFFQNTITAYRLDTE